MQQSAVQMRPANWLPLPESSHLAGVPAVDENDLFSKGVLERWYPGLGKGIVKTLRGDELPFCLETARLVGPKRHRRYLATGGRVGYDVGQTPEGRRICCLKIY